MPPQWRSIQLAERQPHRLFDVAGPFDMAGNTKQFGADIVGPADRGKPRRAAAECRVHRMDSDVVTVVGQAIETTLAGKWRLQPRLALLALETSSSRGLSRKYRRRRRAAT